MIEFYKILNGLDKCDKDQPFTMQPNPRTRGHSQNLYRKKTNKQKTKQFRLDLKNTFSRKELMTGGIGLRKK